MSDGIDKVKSGEVSTFLRKIIFILMGGAFFGIILPGGPGSATAQKSSDNIPRYKTVYVDEEGVMRYRGSDKEVALFGVNYSVPFAHEFRTLNKLGFDHKRQIDRDVYHMARMGVDAFRVHIWDTEISDSLGNLLDNRHLELLDYLVWKLKQRNIRIILTPITYYDNGYPEPPTSTPGFANYISKEEAPRNREYWPVIKRYLKQFIRHENKFTDTSYRKDPNIIALEIVNEPAHDDRGRTTEFINAMADHLRKEEWEKPIFYNISQNPSVAEGVMRASIDGVSFQWYPAGLVGGSEIRRNYLPYIDQYPIPFSDRPEMQSKALMSYEFSPADVPYSYAYAVMARSFREAGFQFATQFAYDALAMGNMNTAYRTHYLNLAYTPSKAIGFRIASAVFHHGSRTEKTVPYPADTAFGDFRVSHARDLAVLNTDSAYYYTGSIDRDPKNVSALKHVAGTGSSPVVSYPGTGAYFLDKLEPGIWRLEIMPDAVPMRDPFAVTAFDKSLAHINWQKHPITVNLPGLGQRFRVTGLNGGNSRNTRAAEGSFEITPGTYLLVKNGKRSNRWSADSSMGRIKLGEFVAPEPSPDTPHVRHEPARAIRTGESMTVEATVTGLQEGDRVTVRVQDGWRPERIEMNEVAPYQYKAEIPQKQVEPGFLVYWISVERKGSAITFPGGHSGLPGEWDYYHEERWKTSVVSGEDPLEIYSADKHHPEVQYAFRFWDSEHDAELIPSSAAGEMATRVRSGGPVQSRSALGWSFSFADRWNKASNAAKGYNQLGIRLRADNLGDSRIKAILVDRGGQSYSNSFSAGSEFEEIRIPFEAFKADSMMLLSRPYPVFLPLWFKGEEEGMLNSEQIEQVQFLLEPPAGRSLPKGASFAVESVWLGRRE